MWIEKLSIEAALEMTGDNRASAAEMLSANQICVNFHESAQMR